MSAPPLQAQGETRRGGTTVPVGLVGAAVETERLVRGVGWGMVGVAVAFAHLTAPRPTRTLSSTTMDDHSASAGHAKTASLASKASPAAEQAGDGRAAKAPRKESRGSRSATDKYMSVWRCSGAIR